MRRVPPALLALTAGFFWVACDFQEATGPGDLEPSFEFLDGSVAPQHHGFYFLPPLVPQPTFDGTFMGNLPVVVEVFAVKKVPNDQDDPEGPFHLEWVQPPVRTFGFPGEVEVDTNGQHYQVNWDTDEIGDLPGDSDLLSDVYRVAVSLNTKLLGFADVELVENGAGFKNLTEGDGFGEIIGLIDGRTLPIKFRIENEMFDIAFHRFSEGDFDVYLLNRTTGAHVNLIDDSDAPANDGGPSWSPDGGKIAFFSDRDRSPGEWNLFVMNADGTSVDWLTNYATPGDVAWKPAWSPDGKWIAFQRGVDDEADIWLVDPVTRVQRQVTDLSGGPFEDIDPTWNPDGRVTYAKSHVDAGGGAPQPDCDGSTGVIWNFDIVSVDIETGAEENHTKDPCIDQTSPAWSHSSNRLVFSERVPEGPEFAADLWMLEPNGDRHHWNLPNPVFPQGSPVPLWLMNQEADFSPGDDEVLFSRGPGPWPLALWTLNPSDVEPTFENASRLLEYAAWGRYRPVTR